MSDLNITDPRAFKKGDEVVADPAFFPGARGIYVVEKEPVGARGVNYVVRPKDDPTGRGLKAPAYCFNAYDPAKDPSGIGVVEVAMPLPIPDNSTLVRVNGLPQISPDDLYVVIGLAAKSMDAVRIQKLGGDGGRYWKSVPIRMLTIIDPSRVTITPED